MFSNGPSIVTTGLDLLVDAADQQSYPGTGTVWRDLRSGTTGSLTGSVSYTSEFYGGLTFSNSSSAVIFPGSTANYGTGSFTVEMTFKPTFINGRHYLMSKNSGSFPNWSIFLSGSNGSGKLFSQFNITATVSCSVTSSTVFETGSVYQVDVRVLPAFSASGIYVNGQSEGSAFGNGGGSLSNTGSLFVGNFSQNNTQNFSGSIYTIKTYTIQSLTQPPINFNTTATRIGKTPTPYVAPVFELLVVAGGGGGRSNRGAGGGAGGLQYFLNIQPTIGSVPVIVGLGGATNINGQNSQFNNTVSIGGGRGQAGNGGSGGGGGGTETQSPGLGTLGQGNNGGSGGNNYDAGGGGGGSSTVGTNIGTAPGAGAYRGGNGGSGSYIPSFASVGGSPAGWFAGGGGGGGDSIGGLGGIGGGGDGNRTGGGTSITGSVNTGGGGGGDSFGQTGKAGGSGIVAIRYSGAPIALGGEITQSAGFTFHVFRTVGTSSFTIF